MKNMTMSEIKKQVPYFFSKDAMQFFKSRIHSKKGLYFVTSEQFEEEPRKYTVRKFNEEYNTIDSVSEFQEFETLDQAKEKMKEYYKEEKKGGK